MNHDRDPKALRPSRFVSLFAGLLTAVSGLPASGAESSSLKFTTGNTADLQALRDKAPPGAVVVCEQTAPLVVDKSLTITTPMTLRGLKAALPPKLPKTITLIVSAKGVTLTDIEMHGDYDTVGGTVGRAPFLSISSAGTSAWNAAHFTMGPKTASWSRRKKAPVTLPMAQFVRYKVSVWGVMSFRSGEHSRGQTGRCRAFTKAAHTKDGQWSLSFPGFLAAGY
jgi:hypothetical protein